MNLHGTREVNKRDAAKYLNGKTIEKPFERRILQKSVYKHIDL